MKILVTGANGFAGSLLVSSLLDLGHQVRGTAREVSSISANSGKLQYMQLDLETLSGPLDEIFEGVDFVVHLAAHVHQGRWRLWNDTGFSKINVEGTKILATAAAEMKIKRFIFLSSIGVNGNETLMKENQVQSLSEEDAASPVNAYTRSKYEAEKVLQGICRTSSMEFVILRAPLIYGPGVKSNFLSLLGGVDHQFPFPLGKVKNLRSMIYIDNLIDVIGLCLSSPAVANRIFLLSDYNLSTPDLISRLAREMDRKSCLWRCPLWILNLLSYLPVAGNVVKSLSRSLVVDSGRLREALDWQPGIGLDEAISSTVDWYLSTRKL